MPVATTVQLRQVRLPAAEEIQRAGRAVFTAEELTDARVLVCVRGEVDATNRQALGRFVQRHTRVSKQLILDLTGVDFFGSQAFTALYYANIQCARRDVDWMVVAGPRGIAGTGPQAARGGAGAALAASGPEDLSGGLVGV